MDLVLSREAVNSLISIIDEDLLRAGADCVLLVDRSGNLIVNRGDPANLDVVALAALSAANFGATSEIAKLIGEDDFALLFHKGKNENIHFTKVGHGFILITLFGKDISLGVIRLKTAKVTEQLIPLLSGEH
ncbi:MAG: roadblock/LC7 domain-containing protein [Deltaproteobacteria bacterium]|nr:roadblock/LC7 domain-containing protein [Deltaproteobacteria bacterium]MBW2072446.1 roadblock/LC7 domain-containing protein [Deltaproteobacteria bacterium]